jgi:hypothetical protein
VWLAVHTYVANGIAVLRVVALRPRDSIPGRSRGVCGGQTGIRAGFLRVLRFTVVGLGTILQAGRWRVRFSMRLLDFSIDLNLPAALWPWGRPSL